MRGLLPIVFFLFSGVVSLAQCPNIYTVNGGGNVCSSGVNVALSNSQTSISYQLMINGINSGSPVTGTGSPLSWPNQTAAGTYTIVGMLTSTGCSMTMTGSAIVTVTGPQFYTLTGSGDLCGAGATLTLSGSETGTSYQLKRNGTSFNSPVSGTGNSVSWTNQTIAGTYSVLATRGSCSSTMNGTVTVSQPPGTLTVSGGGTVCGASGRTVGLNSSQTGVNYQLLINGINSGSYQAGTGSSLSWSNQTTGGTYSVIASVNGCSTAMTGNATITVTTPQAYSLAGSGDLCGGGATVTLSGSQSGATYQLVRGTTNIGSSIAGTGNSINWPNQTTTGTYTVSATGSACTTVMSGSVVVNTAPSILNVTGGGNVTCGSGGVGVNLSSSRTGTNYQLLINGVNSGSPLAGTGSSISWPSQTVAGTYTVVANSGGCTATMNGSVTVSNVNPQLYTLAGSGNLCGAAPGGTMTLNGSQTGTTYQLIRSGTNVGSAVSGTGSTITWSNQTTSGTYTISATRSGCAGTMNGSVVINPPPASQNVTGGGGVCISPGVSIGLNNSTTGVNYQLMINGSSSGSPLAGTTGRALSWSNQTTIGTYAIIGTMPNGCSTPMSGSATVTSNVPQSFNLTGTGNLCSSSPNATITLSSSQTGVSYQLKNYGNSISSPVAGTGGLINWNNVNGSGTYTIEATFNSCKAVMSGNIVTAQPPQAYAVRGGGNVCASQNQASVSLAQTENATSYQLLLNGANYGSPQVGSVQGISWTGLTQGGTYTISATNAPNCSTVMSGSANVTAMPVLFTVGGGGNACPGNGTSVSLSSSEIGVNYQPYRNGAAISTPSAGTGNALTWQGIISAGTYTIWASNSCPQTPTMMTGNVVVTATTSPTQFGLSADGAGILCPAFPATTISLAGSQSGINYQLVINGTNSGAPVAGTNSSLTWPNQTTQGQYTVVATDPITSCTQSTAAEIVVSEATYNLFSTGAYCAGGVGATVTLNNSQPGVNYQLIVGGNNIVNTAAGTGSALLWTNQPAGTYTVVGSSPNCTMNMSGSPVVKVNPVPGSSFSVGVVGSSSYCPGNSGVSISLSGSEPGIEYRLRVNTYETGNALAGTGGALTWPNLQREGTYKIIGSNVVTECNATMSGTATVAVNTIPASFSVSGGGILPSGSSGATVSLSGSEPGVTYQLELGSSAVGASAGTGYSLSWPNLAGEGTYVVVATKTSNTCSNQMTGAAEVRVASSDVVSILKNYAFQYVYDYRNRLAQKKIPGADPVYMVYDDRDRVVLTQDGNQRFGNQWTFTKYDAFNRPVSTGIYGPGGTPILQTDMQTAVNNYYKTGTMYETFSTDPGNVHNYDNKSFPPITDPNQYLTVTYYDNNTSIGNVWGSTSFGYTSDNLVSGIYSQPGTGNDFRTVTGHPVAGKTKLLDGSNTWLKTTFYYDDHYRMIQTISDNVKGGVDRVSDLYDFTGKLLTTKTTHNTSTHPSLPVVKTFDYDHMGRLMRIWYNVNNSSSLTLIASNSYNEIGQLINKKLHSVNNGSSFKQTNDYAYNIRGWLTSINDSQLPFGANSDNSWDLFGMNLFYDQQDAGLNNQTQFNGNISAIKWSNDMSLGVVKDNAYTYTYDAMNRITSSTFMTDPGTWTASTNFTENGFSYDLNGNILSLRRTDNNGALQDALVYDYTGKGNQLRSVTDNGNKTAGFIDGNVSGDDYVYDSNGNMAIDNNKNIVITYSFPNNSQNQFYLNLPRVVTKTAGKIANTYDASRRKLKKQVYTAGGDLQKTTDYVGEFIYQNDTLEFINTEEGRIVMTGGAPEYQYHLKDHLGNVRMTITSKVVIDQPVATFEPASQNTEHDQFQRYDDARRVNSTLFDHTHNGTTAYSERLTGSANERTGIARSISVMPGDKIDLTVYAKYVDPNNTNNTVALTQFIAQVVGGTTTGGTVLDGSGYSTNGATPFPYTGSAGEGGSTGSGPKAFMNYLIFDRNYRLLNVGYVQVSSAAKEDGTTVTAANPYGNTHERLSAGIYITQPGYVYTYLSNEEMTPLEVYFDDFTVTQTKSPVVQMEDFYPFGAVAQSYSRENSVPNKFLFQGKELQTDLGLNLEDFGWRQDDPFINRTTTPDPHAYNYPEVSPYSFLNNNPNNTDPDGMDVVNEPMNITSTFVKPDGTIIEHRDDGDPNIYLVTDEDAWNKGGKQKDGLPVRGFENPDHEYKPGQKVDLNNPDHNLFAPSPGNADPDYTIEGFALPLFGWMKALRFAKFGSLAYKITDKIAKQLAKRGWSEEMIEKALNKAYTTRPAVNKATGNQATAYFLKDGSHVVVDNVTKDVIQVSDRTNVQGWIPDTSIVNPYIPKK